MQLALVQLDIAWEDPATNYARVRALLDAAPPPADSLVILPEMFATGFTPRVAAAAQSPACEAEQFLRELATERRVATLGGVAAPLADGMSRNEAVGFAPDGSEWVRYAKRQPFTPMREHLGFAAGDRSVLGRWRSATIAPLICYDLRFPELFRPAARAGAELFVVIANWPEIRAAHWRTLLAARAIENQAFVVGVTRAGNDPYARYRGGSVVFDPHGQCVAEADEREQVLAVDVDLGEVAAWRDKFPALRDARYIAEEDLR